MSDLNLGLDSAVFLDDSSFERARVKKRCLKFWFRNCRRSALSLLFLPTLKCFDNPFISQEDRARTRCMSRIASARVDSQSLFAGRVVADVGPARAGRAIDRREP